MLLALAFTLQLSWGMVSAYCMHESGTASEHFGHHQHTHTCTTASADDDSPSAPKKAVSHPDCATCTHGPMAAIAWTLDVAQPSPPTYAQASRLREQAAPYLGSPERPQWRAAAWSGDLPSFTFDLFPRYVDA